jgi:hypothetical protein
VGGGGREEMCMYDFENMRGREYWKDPGLGVRIILKWIFEEWGGRVWIWLQIVKTRRLLRTW